MKKILFTFLLFAIFGDELQAQPPHIFTQYTSENGLNQRTVQDILQDHKGMMWFATWDGLYKFDGYTFKNNKTHPGDNVDLNNNRIYDLHEDRWGYIWGQSYDHKVFRFDPKMEKFELIPYNNYLCDKLFIIPNGDVWIATTQQGILHLTTNSKTHAIEVENFSTKNKIPLTSQINNIFIDSKSNLWLLTTNGIYKINKDKKNNNVEYFMVSNTNKANSFYEAVEYENDLYLCSTNGQLWKYSNNKFSVINFPTESSIKFLRKLDAHLLFLGTASDGLFLYNLNTQKTDHYNTSNCAIKDNHIKEVYIDSQNEIWIRQNQMGVTHFNPKNLKFDHFILKDKYGYDIVDSRFEMLIHEDINGNLWIHPSGGGLAWYDRGKNCILPFYNTSLQSGWSSDNKVTGFYPDKQGNLWLCSYGNGLEKVTFNDGHFNFLAAHSSDNEFPGNNSRAIFQDKNENIWVGCKDNIIRVYNSKLKYIGNLSFSGKVIPNSNDKFGIGYSFTQDHKGTIWIGTKTKGLIAAMPTKEPYTFNLQYFTSSNNDIYSLSGNDIYSLHEDKNYRLWIATFDGGVNYLDLKDNSRQAKFINSNNDLKNYPIKQCFRSRFVTSDSKGNVWIASTNGLLMCKSDFSDPKTLKFSHFSRIPSDESSLSNNDVHNIFESQSGDIYISTFGGGLNKLISINEGHAKFKSYTSKDGLPSDIILSVQEDNKQNLWFVTEEGLSKFNPSTGEIENFSSKNFPKGTKFNEGAALKTREGSLMFNTVKGILHFRPDSVKVNKYVPPIVFTNFQQDDEVVAPREGGILTTDIDDMQLIKLPHDKNSFTIQFAALDLRYPNSISYAYQIEGFDKNWNYIGNQRTATYTNLPKGTYTLKVKSTNSDGMWTENTRTIEIEVLPSFWETTWALILYILAVLLAIAVVSFILFTFFRLKHKVNLEQELSDVKLRFFTDISHELRTPLTLIVGPVDQIIESENLSTEEKEQLTLVKKNTNRMLNLVNQILDFRKIQNKKMKILVQQVDLVPFVSNVMANFDAIADEHQIDFQLETQTESLIIWVDVDKLEKILFNLISNAFKYTPKNKQIKLGIQNLEHEVCISVADQGIGISENKQNSLFVRFENLVDKTIYNHPSSGIGLSLVKELVDLHHGKITISSKQNEGSCFNVFLLKGKEHFEESTEFLLNDDIITGTEHLNTDALVSFISSNDNDTFDKDSETLLIVEDNPELRFFLKTIFVQQFNVIEAENGLVGLEKSKQYVPDIIISDVMMPEMDGIELTQALRENITTSHIPIILLTAKSTIESKIQGLKYGADDYITKPFSAAYLKARIDNLIEQRKKLQSQYRASLQPATSLTNQQTSEAVSDEKKSLDLSPYDQKFMNQVMSFIQENIDNGMLKVEDISTDANMSRSVFFKKIKSLTGLSPNEFLKEIRMKKAAQLIDTGEFNMSQVAYMVGINDPHYFSKCFKQQFGTTPTEYKDKKRS